MRYKKFLLTSMIVVSGMTGLVSAAVQAEPTSEQSILKQAKIHFSKDKVYEMAYVSIIPGKEQQVFANYFPKALPLAAKYGGKSMGMLAVPGVKDGREQAQMVAIFEWPSVGAWFELHKDPDFLKIVSIRDDAMAFGNPGNFYTVNEDLDATFTEGKMYELANYTLKQDDDGWSSKKSIFDQYIEQEKGVSQSFGSQQNLTFVPVPMSNYMQEKIKITCGHHNGFASDDQGLMPQMMRIREWSSFKAFDHYQMDGSSASIKKLKNDAVQFELTLKTVFGFPAG
ncbi:MAG: DUF1330 domain-containing protein [Bermanella sp.]